VKVMRASTKKVTCGDGANKMDLPRWSTVTWASTIECAGHVDCLWPLQAWCHRANTMYPYIWHEGGLKDTRHFAQGVDDRAILQATPCQTAHVVSATEVNPDADIQGSGKAQLVIDTTNDTVGCFNANGQFVGRVTLRRLHQLEHRWNTLHDDAPGPPTLQDAILGIMVARGLQKAPQRGQRQQPQRWQPSDGLLAAIQAAFGCQTEWFSSPLSNSEFFPMFASAYPHDTAFGAIHDAYANAWSGSGFFNPPNSPLEAAKAMRWALQSTTAPTPVINVGVLSESSDTKHLDRFLDNDRVHLLCRVQTNSTRSRETTCWHNIQPSVFRNSEILWIVLVFNGGGLAQVQHDQLQSFRQSSSGSGSRFNGLERGPTGYNSASGSTEAISTVPECHGDTPERTATLA